MPLDPPPIATGLTATEAALRLAADGPNALRSSKARGALALAAGVARDPMFMLLIAAGAIYLVLGDFFEALALAASIGVIFVITVAQERRTERTLEALRDLSSPRALVVRDGREVRVPGTDVVRGDLMLLQEGDRVAADARLVEVHDLLVDESLLTGESAAVEKSAAPHANVEAYAGTLVVRGHARGVVTGTGERSQLGRIASTLAAIETGKSSLERETARVVRFIAIAALGLCVIVALAYIAMRGGVLDGLLAGLTLAMAILPEEYPVVLTVFLALGAWRIAKQGVLTRRLAAVETLGAATVLCCDKTGTLTENRMRVAEAWRHGAWRGAEHWGSAEEPLLVAAALACEERPFDPMERAVLEAGERWSAQRAEPGAEALERRYPLSGGFLAVAHGWRQASGKARVAMKGAPETVLALCDCAPEARAAALAAAGQAAARGLRVLAVAEADHEAGPWLADVRAYRWRFSGLIAMADPLRSAVPGAVALCHRAGIRVVMITGDHPATARAIAAQAGIDAAHVFTGTELAGMDDPRLAEAVSQGDVFARVRPEQKLRLVNALRAAGEVVAMTGDGVNDAPALKAADIGIAMGKRGTDVAREAAALVLLEDDFTSIVATIRLGRRIYENIRNAMRYLLAVHVPLAGMALLPIAVGWPLFVFPLHVVFLEFVIDPACSIVFEAERSDAHVMDAPPRPVAQPLFTAASVAMGILLGASVLAAVALVYGWSLATGAGENEARALGFTTLVCGNIALIFANRSHRSTLIETISRHNAAAWWLIGATTAALLAALHVPAAARLFHFAAPAPAMLAAAALAGFASVLWYDGVKVARRRGFERRP